MSPKISILWVFTSSDDSATKSLLLNIPTNPFAEIGFPLGLTAKKSSVIKEIKTKIFQLILAFLKMKMAHGNILGCKDHKVLQT